MTIPESLTVALFCVAGVFLALISLFFILRLFSFALGLLSSKKTAGSVPAPVRAGDNFSSGNLELKNVEEPIAAMIMAIVSDESGIPLSELRFQSIKLIQRDEPLSTNGGKQ